MEIIQLPKIYQWLNTIPVLPKMVQEFIKIYGVRETIGPGDNPEILAWAKEVGLQNQYKHDITPWCGLEMALLAKRAGKSVPKDPLWALNWLNFGIEIPKEQVSLGDVMIFKRTGGGHVCEYIAEDSECYHCAGGNEGDMSNIVRIRKERLFAARRPIYNIMPESVKKYFMDAHGNISSNEA